MKNLMSHRKPLLLVALTVVATALAGPYEDEVDAALTAYGEALPSSYSVLPAMRSMRTLAEGKAMNITYTLSAGYVYTFAGACDSDCADIDLELRDAQGKLLTADTSSDDNPVVSVSPTVKGKYTLKVYMRDCSSPDGCVYGVDVFRKSNAKG